MTNPSKANQRFEISALALGIELEIVSFPRETRTAKQAAHAVQCELGQIVKSLVFKTNDNEVVRFKSGGNVGIGTNNPRYPLVVSGSGQNSYIHFTQDNNSTSDELVILC